MRRHGKKICYDIWQAMPFEKARAGHVPEKNNMERRQAEAGRERLTDT